MSDLNFVPADAVDPAVLHAAFTAAFSDYLIGPFTLSLAQWPQFLARQGADLAQSRGALRGAEVVAFALVAPRADTGGWRLATMGSLPEARGSGAAPALLDDFIQRAAQAGVPWVELECFAQNERALRLYRSRGFEALHPLHGYARAAGVPLPSQSAQPVAAKVTRDAAFAWLDELARERGDLPLQVTPTALRALAAELQFWRTDSAQLVFALTGEDSIVVHSLVDAQRDQRGAQALAAELIRRYPARRIAVPQLQRPDLGGEALERLGFERLPLHQLLMRRQIA